MTSKRKQYTSEFKFKAVMESFQRDTTLHDHRAFQKLLSNGVGSVVHILEKGVERLNEFRTNRAQLCLMGERELAQHLFSLWGEVDENPSLISLIPTALDETALNEPIDQLDGAMMRELEPLGQRADGRFPSLRQTLDGKEQLMLLGLKTRSSCRLLAEAEKAAKLIAKFGSCLILSDRALSRGRHPVNLSVGSPSQYQSG